MTTMNPSLFAAVLACSVTLVFSISCHQCQTYGQKECKDPYSTDTSGECDDDHYCVKYKTIVWIRDSGYINGWERESSVVTRTCEPRQGKNEGCNGWQNNGGITIKCYCGSDNCNAAQSLTSKFLTALLGCLFGIVVLQTLLRH